MKRSQLTLKYWPAKTKILIITN